MDDNPENMSRDELERTVRKLQNESAAKGVILSRIRLETQFSRHAEDVLDEVGNCQTDGNTIQSILTHLETAEENDLMDRVLTEETTTYDL